MHLDQALIVFRWFVTQLIRHQLCQPDTTTQGAGKQWCVARQLLQLRQQDIPNACAFFTGDRQIAGAVANPRCDARLSSEEHTSALQSLLRSSNAVYCLKKKKNK